jgi:predicted Zn-dependent protease with MMP-like domain
MTEKLIIPPSLDEIETIMHAAFNTLPDKFRALTKGIEFRVHDFPDQETIIKKGLQSPFDLMGLYNGAKINKKHSGTLSGANKMLLYRRPLLDYWCEIGEDLSHLVRHVIIYEIGHHFGLSDEDMEQIEAPIG